MIKLTTFKKAIEAIKKQQEKELKFCKALEDIIDGRFVPEISTDILHALIECLEDVMGDVIDEHGGWISWWIYEKDFGKEKKMTAHYKNGRLIKLDTIEDLYIFLKKNKRG